MDDGTCVYFGPWNAAAQQLLSKYLPASHLLAAGGNAEQPRDTKKKVVKKEETKKVRVEPALHFAVAPVEASKLGQDQAIDSRPPFPSLLLQTEDAGKAKRVHSASLTLKSALWEYCWDARWIIFCLSLFFFLTAQASRQVGGCACNRSQRGAASSSLSSTACWPAQAPQGWFHLCRSP